MFEYLYYLSYILIISNGVVYQPFLDYVSLNNNKYQIFPELYSVKEAINICQCFSIILLFFSFWGDWLAMLGIVIMLPHHLIGSWVSFNQISNNRDEHEKCIRNPVDVLYFNMSFLLSIVDIYVISGYVYSFF